MTNTPDLSDLFIRPDVGQMNASWLLRDEEEWRSLYSMLAKAIKSLIGLPNHIHHQAMEHAKQYMLNRIEPDGTFYGYFSSTFLMIFALIVPRLFENSSSYCESNKAD